MEPIQATIRIERGRIQSVEPMLGGVKIISEAGIDFYPDCWALPGFVDSHAHILGLGSRLRGLSLYGAESAEECVGIAIMQPITRGGWIVGMGWNQQLWTSKQYPTKYSLDIAFTDVPVYLSRADGHAAWVNSASLTIAGITAATSNPPGGEIMKDKSGNPTGILVDNAMDLVRKFIPAYTTEEQISMLRASADHCIARGITEVHDMDVASGLLPIFSQLAERAELPIRVQSYVKAQENEWMHEGLLPAVGEFFRICGLKYYADGALGSRGAALLEPYSDAPHTKGLFLISENDLYRKAKIGLEYQWDISTHAIGDAANRMVLDVYERLRKEGLADSDAILRIEHAQIVHPDDAPRFAEWNVVAAVQPVHCISDASMARERLGERCLYGYPWRTLRNSGIGLAAGSDFPIEPANPLLGIDAYVRRVPFGEEKGWYDKECLTRQEALLSYTLWAHEAAGMSYRRGILQTKFDADIVIHNANIAHCPEKEITSASVVASYTAGVIRYKNDTL
ncbi:MAG: amidohydrolase family protein [Ignavibacteriae bacterium]|nr:amidohydrolase family protein [Ignavibacteriota bacterium]